jgi:hypothetical protein
MLNAFLAAWGNAFRGIAIVPYICRAEKEVVEEMFNL